MAKSSFRVGFSMEGQLFDPSFDPHPADNRPDTISTVYNHIDEQRYYYFSGVTDGREGVEDRNTLVPPDFRVDYSRGWSDGRHFYKFLHFF